MILLQPNVAHALACSAGTLAGVLVLSASSVWAQQPRDLPDGPGKAIIMRDCVGCHQPTAFSTYKHTPEEWTAIVNRMGARTKTTTPPELESVAKYLAASFPKVDDTTKVNVNKAGAQEIAERLGLTKQEAALIVDYRAAHGNFRVWGDLLIIYGLNGRKVQAAQDRMSF